MNILIVDDEKDINFVLSLELQALGHQTTCFDKVQNAIEYLEIETPDVIICDYQMPGMNGMDLFSWIKKHEKNIAFYLLTGEPTMETDKLKKLGITDILYKPQDLLRLSTIFK